MCNLLALDTSSVNCSVAYYGGSGAPEPLSDLSIDMINQPAERHHTRLILPMVDEILERHHVKLEQLDALAFGCGPGSFTGLRIAAGIAQGLAFGADLPVIAVSNLAALAVAARQAGSLSEGDSVLACIDARMDEVYYAWFKIESGLPCLVGEECVARPEDIVFEQGRVQDKVVCVGSGSVFISRFARSIRESIGDHVIDIQPTADTLMPLAIDKFQKQQTLAAHQAQPTYIRDTVTWQKLPGK